MAVTTIPNVTNWSVTPQNGQAEYFTLMNTWLSESTAVLASLQTAINAQNTANSEINDLAIQTENNANIAASVGNYQGVWSNLVTYSKSMGVSVGTLYYISKVDSNLNHAVTDTNYWLYNPINDKLDKDFSVLEDKTTPADSDIFATRETGGLLKKLSWANLKAALKTYFDTLYAISSSVFGLGQSWQDVAGSRALNITYTNSTSKPIVVSVGGLGSLQGNFLYSTVGGIDSVGFSGIQVSSQYTGINFIVPSGVTYSVSISGGALSGLIWVELR